MVAAGVEDGKSQPERPEPPAGGNEKNKKSPLWLLLKLTITLGGLFLIYRTVLDRDGIDEFKHALSTLRWQWVAAGIGMQLIAVFFATLRWRELLRGQNISGSFRFLFGSVLIARFWGAFTPGGFTGFGGWRIYDIAMRTEKPVRAATTIAIEVLLGQLAFGVVAIIASVWGFRFVGTEGVLLVNAFFLPLIVVVLTFLTSQKYVRIIASLLPNIIRSKVERLVDAASAYDGKWGLLSRAFLYGVGVHTFNNFIYVCAAQAINVELGVGEIFFASTLQIFATLLPAFINGMGIREATAVALYTSPAIGLSKTKAILIANVGFVLCEMAVSACGGLIFLWRRGRGGHVVTAGPIHTKNVDEDINALLTRPLVSRKAFTLVRTWCGHGCIGRQYFRTDRNHTHSNRRCGFCASLQCRVRNRTLRANRSVDR